MVLLFHGRDARKQTSGQGSGFVERQGGSCQPAPGAAFDRSRTPGRAPGQGQSLAIVLSLFLVLLAAATLVGGRAVIDPMLGAAAEAREANRVGGIVFTMPDGAVCRHLSFDNTTAEMSESSAARCPEARPRGGEPARSAKGFAWGAH